jgi:hypothetical protein
MALDESADDNSDNVKTFDCLRKLHNEIHQNMSL